MNATRKALNDMLVKMLMEGEEDTYMDYEEFLDFTPPTTIEEIESLSDAQALELLCIYGTFLG